ncbi:ent-kaurenoic acid oxidase 2-like [Cornus florida]|uniref:ent-kaurenoic acid oxidase 2-like n=1 Tax=Cornus florida TaxID=4283 RepID=UPI00289BC985|nr:ent-kaurenoic acid oxidase 2-like [Cornus florida]
MEYDLGWLVLTALIGGIVALLGLLKRVNEWIYVSSLGAKQYSLPPGDMGWPFIGNMWSLFRAFKNGEPDSFISAVVTRFGAEAQIYKAFMFGNPCVIVTTSETCRRVLMDDVNFGHGSLKSITKLIGKKGFHGLSNEEHRRIRRATTAPIKGRDSLSVYIDLIEDIAMSSFEEWARMDRPVEFLTELRKVAFKVIMNIIMSDELEPKAMDIMEMEYTRLSHGVKSMPINLPGFAYREALKARKYLVKNFQDVVDKRRATMKSNQSKPNKDVLSIMIETEDEDGQKLSDEEIIDLIIMFLLTGHESSAHATTWVMIFLQENPQCLQKAKEEQEEIIRRRPPTQSRLSHNEIRQMEYLSKVIDETLRVANLSFALFREAKTDVNINGYIVPKGWKVLAWIRNIHVNPENYPNPKEFNPSRWDGHTTKPGAYIPFGAGSRLCPGGDLAKLEVSVFLHYFLLNYKLERLNPKCGVKYLPIPKPKDNCLARIKKLSASP